MRFAVLGALAGALAVARTITRDAAAAIAFYDAAIAKGHEGVMAKALDAPYDAGSRGAAWLEDQARAPARPRRARGRVGQRPAQGLAVEHPSRRARPATSG